MARFIKGHWSKTPAYRAMKERFQSKPPKTWKVPSGVCECGCGKKTKIATLTSGAAGHYAGYPLRFVHGHNVRLMQGASTSRWRGGRWYQDGYIMLWTGKNSYQAEHILVWEKKHGPVPRGYHIHHINRVRDDNRLTNLLCMTRSQHKALHEAEDKANGTGRYRKFREKHHH